MTEPPTAPGLQDEHEDDEDAWLNALADAGERAGTSGSLSLDEMTEAVRKRHEAGSDGLRAR